MFTRILRKTFFSLLLISLGSIGLLIYFQDYLVFPQLRFQRSNPVPQSTVDTPPKGGELFYLSANDGTKIQVARQPSAPSAQEKPEASKKIIAFFHGNGGTIHRFYNYMNSFAAKGFTVYQLEYRGYGGSGGWPSMERLLSDAELLFDEISKREGVAKNQIVPVGVSLGTGIAATLAARHQAPALGLISAYTTLKNAGRDRPIIGIFAGLMWNDIDAISSVAQLKNTCAAAIHGTNDAIISYKQSEELQRAYRGSAQFKLMLIPNGDHNNVFWEKEEDFMQSLQQCAIQH